ncbi:MAG: mycothiol transferase [Ornithinimicrobium sp.]|uniref:mycothiol transferase n=1 Tax=Ornithinimicrobium sp. TaxID=1977084 RepID=UPI003D9B3CB6
MTPAELLIESFSRVPEVASSAVSGLSEQELAHRPDADANSIAWLVWHLARAQDAQVAPLAGQEQVWRAAGWQDHFDLPFAAEAMGYGQSSADVASVRASPDLLLGYLDAVHKRTVAYLQTLSEDDLDRVIDADDDPPITVGVRLVSVLDDCAQHAGQAAYLRGLIDRAD